jgi:phosphoglycolate phosphatase
VSHFFAGFPFERVYGLNEEIPHKPDPTGVRRIMREMDLRPEEVLYMGDTDTDMKTAVAANLYAIGVTWGFRNRQELITHGANLVIDTPDEWLSLLD